MSFHTPPHKHVGDEGKPGQTVYLEINPERVRRRVEAAYSLPFGSLSKSTAKTDAEMEALYQKCKAIADTYPQVRIHLSSSDKIPSPLRTQTGKGPFVPLSHIIKDDDLPAGVRKARTDGDRLLETFAGAAACKLWWWPTDNGR